MTDGRWYTSDAMPALGTELFQSRRRIRVWEQTVSHGQLLLRAMDTGAYRTCGVEKWIETVPVQL